MKTVYKYPLRLTDVQKVPLPKGAEILSVQFQGEQLCLWALVDPEVQVIHPREVFIHGTGHNVEYAGVSRYIGTVQQFGGSLIWHVFYGLEATEILMENFRL